jgi:hypothetical protein
MPKSENQFIIQTLIADTRNLSNSRQPLSPDQYLLSFWVSARGLIAGSTHQHAGERVIG